MSNDKQRRPQAPDPAAYKAVPAHNPIGAPPSGDAAQGRGEPANLTKAAWEDTAPPAGVDYAKERGRR
jgi:hypothetical protein